MAIFVLWKTHASWCCPKAEVDFRVGGSSSYRMEAKDGRKVDVKFVSGENFVILQQRFEAESENACELQQQGWQAILNQFKSYCDQ